MGNPNWGKPSNLLIPAPYVPSGFEQTVESLGLHPEAYTSSLELKKWVHRHFKTRYVPESLLESWGLELDIGEL